MLFQDLQLCLLRVLLPQQRTGGGQRAHTVAALVGDGGLLQQLCRFHMPLGLHGHHAHALGGAGGLGRHESRVEGQHSGLGGVNGDLRLLIQTHHGRQGGLVGVGAGELAAVGGGLIGLHLHPCGLAVFKEEEKRAAVVPGEDGIDHVLTAVHLQLAGEILAQDAGLGVIKLPKAGLVDLAAVGEEHDLGVGGGLKALAEAVALLELLLAAHAQGLRGDLLEIALPGEEDVDGIFCHLFFLHCSLDLMGIDDGGLSGLAVLFGNGGKLIHDDLLQPAGAVQDIFQILDLILQGGGLLHPLEDVFLVDVAQLDLRHILCLHLVDAKADHQVGDDLGVRLRFPDNADGLVDIQQDALEAL